MKWVNTGWTNDSTVDGNCYGEYTYYLSSVSPGVFDFYEGTYSYEIRNNNGYYCFWSNGAGEYVSVSKWYSGSGEDYYCFCSDSGDPQDSFE